MMDDDFPESVRKCLDILDENVEILTDLEFNLDDEKEDELTPNMELHNLYDMTEDVAQSAKIKRAELNYSRRQAEDSL
jgi:flagellin-specific chaperone FliS